MYVQASQLTSRHITGNLPPFGVNFVPHFANRTADTDSRAWPAIYGFPNKEGTGNFEKDPQWWNKTVTGVVNILDADDAGHRRMRRLQNPAFSDKALRAQESVICGYASLLVHKLHGLCSGGSGGVSSGDGSAVVDMTAWYNFTTFGKSTVFSLCGPRGRLSRYGLSRPHLEVCMSHPRHHLPEPPPPGPISSNIEVHTLNC